jgi:aconitate hydratase
MINEPIGTGSNGEPVFLRDIWPTNEEIRQLIDEHVHSDMFRSRYADVFRRRALARDRGHRRRDLRLAARIDLHRQPALLHRHDDEPVRRATSSARGAGGVRRFDHHRPHLAGRAIKADSPAGRYLIDRQVSRASSTATARGAATTK